MDAEARRRHWRIGLGVVLGLGIVVYLLRQVLAPVLFALILAYFLNPLVEALMRWRLSRRLAVGVTFLVSTLLFSLVGFALVVLVQREAVQVAETLPQGWENLQLSLNGLSQAISGKDAPAALNEWMDKAFDWLREKGPAFAASKAGLLVQGAFGVIGFVTSLFLIPIFTVFFLADFPALRQQPMRLVPLRHREQVRRLAGEIDEVLSGFVHAQLTVCLVLGLLYGTAYTLVGVPLGFPIGLIAGALAFIPYVGAGLGLFLALVLGVLEWQGVWLPLATLAAYASIQALDAFLITPRLVGNKVGLSPVVVILALMVGGALFGFTGVLLALPTTAALKIILAHAFHRYEGSNFFKGDDPSSSSGAAEP